jgi:rare lipoprotein A
VKKNIALGSLVKLRVHRTRPSRLPPPAARGMLFAIALALTGCGTTVPRQDHSLERPATAAAAPPAPAPRGGGYYLDDGPGEKPPPNLDQVPDAVPRVESLHRGALRPYTVMGRSYTPMTRIAPYRVQGMASWYGRRYHGKPTSSGEPYDMYAMTAAHPVLPIPSYARVTNVRNGKHVIVRINDRGPFLGERVIDLSYTAALKLDVLAAGSALVEVESILPEHYAEYRPRGSAPSPASADPVGDLIAGLSAGQENHMADATPESAAATSVPAHGALFLQLGAFGSRNNADSYLSQLKAELAWLAERLQVMLRDGYYRVHAGPYETEAQAHAAAERLAQVLGTRPLLVSR